ncbi:MAG TPA: hypothetical protein VJT09_19260 [Pyrinomonadaceae bacterium]|nr:hypothetical protein [Pyrinomonadaceae bacterium]
MEQQVAIQDVDALLVPFLFEKHEGEAEKLLAGLMNEQVEPVITKIIKHKLKVPLSQAQGGGRNQDALEIAGDVRAGIISELRRLKDNPGGKAINNLQQYAAIKTYSACADYFREKNPRRWRLKNSLRHHLKHDSRFALWESENRRWLCGLSHWHSTEPLAAPPQPPSESQDALLLLSSTGVNLQLLPPAELLAVIFERAGHAIEFDQLVSMVAQVRAVRDEPLESIDDESGSLRANLADRSVRVDAALEQRLYLEKLWAEVCALPQLQRVALLLNLRDAGGGSVIAFIPYLKIASKEEMAEILSMSEEQFAALWSRLPLDDASIAELLGVTRQQVINLRKTARERLSRRMKAGENNP